MFLPIVVAAVAVCASCSKEKPEADIRMMIRASIETTRTTVAPESVSWSAGTLYNIDGRIERTQDNLAKLRLDHAEAQKIVAEPFPQQEELDTKEQRLKVVTDELNQAAIEAKKNAPKREKTCYFERAKMKRDAARLGKKPKTPKNQTKGRSKKQGIE